MTNTFFLKKKKKKILNLVINQKIYGYTNIVNFTITQLLLIFGFFLFPTFTVHMTAGKGGRHLFNSSLQRPPPRHRHLEITQVITAEGSPLLC